MTNLPRLELTGDPNIKNDFVIFRHQNHKKNVAKSSSIHSKHISRKKKRNNITKKHKKYKSIFNIL